MYWKRSSLLAELADVGQLIKTIDVGFTPVPSPVPLVSSGKTSPATIQPPGFFDPLTGQFMAVQPGIATGIQAPPFSPAGPPAKPMPKPIAPSAELIDATKSSIAGIQKQIDFLKSQKESVTAAIKNSESELNSKIKAIKQQAPKEVQVKLITDETAKAAQKINSSSAAIQAISAAEAQAKKRMDDLIDTYNEERMARIRQEQAYTEALAKGKSVAEVTASYDPEFQASMQPGYWKTKGKTDIEAMRPGAPGFNLTRAWEAYQLYAKIAPMVSEARERASGAKEALINAASEAMSAAKRGISDISFKAESGSNWFQETTAVVRKGLDAKGKIDARWDEIEHFLIGGLPRPTDKYSAARLAEQVKIGGMALQGKEMISSLMGGTKDIVADEVGAKVKHEMSKLGDPIRQAIGGALHPYFSDEERTFNGQKLYDLIKGGDGLYGKLYGTAFQYGIKVAEATKAATTEAEKRAVVADLKKTRELDQDKEKLAVLQKKLQSQRPRRYSGADEDTGTQMDQIAIQQQINKLQKKIQEASQ